MTGAGRIVADDVRSGRPHYKGILVSVLLGRIFAGETGYEVFRDYGMTRRDEAAFLRDLDRCCREARRK